MEHPRVEYFKDAAGEYRWRLRAKNGRIIADCGEGYKRKRDCKNAYDRIVQYMLDTVLEVHHEDSWKT